MSRLTCAELFPPRLARFQPRVERLHPVAFDEPGHRRDRQRGEARTEHAGLLAGQVDADVRGVERLDDGPVRADVVADAHIALGPPKSPTTGTIRLFDCSSFTNANALLGREEAAVAARSRPSSSSAAGRTAGSRRAGARPKVGFRAVRVERLQSAVDPVEIGLRQRQPARGEQPFADEREVLREAPARRRRRRTARRSPRRSRSTSRSGGRGRENRRETKSARSVESSNSAL